MYSRYQNITIETDENGKSHYRTVIYNLISDTSDDIIYTVKEGDRLDLLAKQFYDDATFWWVISRKNLLGKPTMYLTPGTILIIPSKSIQELTYIKN